MKRLCDAQFIVRPKVMPQGDFPAHTATIHFVIRNHPPFTETVVILQSSQICTAESLKTSLTAFILPAFKSSVTFLPVNLYKQFSSVLFLIKNKKEGQGMFRNPYTGKQKGVRG